MWRRVLWIGWMVVCLGVAGVGQAGEAVAVGSEGAGGAVGVAAANDGQGQEKDKGWRGRLGKLVKAGVEAGVEAGLEELGEAEQDGNDGPMRRAEEDPRLAFLEGLWMTNLEDPGRPFEIVRPLPVLVQNDWVDLREVKFTSGGLRRQDPMAMAVSAALEKVAQEARAWGADAVLGLTVDLENRNQVDKGRVLVYGTPVRWTTVAPTAEATPPNPVTPATEDASSLKGAAAGIPLGALEEALEELLRRSLPAADAVRDADAVEGTAGEAEPGG